ncbi:hypothetical protein M2T00_27355, partial [Klebsiella pneumoniae]|nr:hypothetical protein [Klebsiella pneumoniae]
PAFEWVHVQLHQQKGMISLSPPTICNSALERLLPARGNQKILFRYLATLDDRNTIALKGNLPIWVWGQLF